MSKLEQVLASLFIMLLIPTLFVSAWFFATGG